MIREAIYQALADELVATAGLQTVSRVYRSPKDYSASAQLPAGCLDELSEEAASGTIYGVDTVWTLRVDLWLYLAAPQLSQIPGQETVVPATALNTILDAVNAAFPSESGALVNTLGGLVQHAYIQGKILKIAGVGNGNMSLSIARVPLEILAV